MCTKKQSKTPIEKDLVLSICCFVSPYESHSTSLLSERQFQRRRFPAPARVELKPADSKGSGRRTRGRSRPSWET